MLGVGPEKTTRLAEIESPVDAILAERCAKHIKVNILRYFSDPTLLDDKAKVFLQRGMALAMGVPRKGWLCRISAELSRAP